MRKLSIIVFLMFSLMLSGMTLAASIDVTAPGDTVKGVPDDANSWPAGEAPQYVIDNKADTKYLNFDGAIETTGIQVTASLGGMVVNEMTLTTANDAPERDPVTFELYGSNDSIDGPYTLIASGEVVDFNQADPWPRGTKNETPISFAAVAYAHYQVLFTAVRDAGTANSMQIAEVELLATLPDLTEPWVYKDIGTSSGGNAWEDAGAYIVRAGGHDIWGNSDGLGYLCRPLLGDGSLEVKLTSMDVTDDWAKAGVMIRETSAADSKFALMAMSGVNGVALAYRSSTGGGCADIQTAGQAVPEILKLSRVGDEFFAQYGFELAPGMWVMVDQGSTYIPMNPDVLIGLAVTSHNTDLLCMSVFEEMVSDIPIFNGPWDMAPADGSTGLPSRPTLTWLPGESATSHEVYLGTDSAALPLVATKALGDESYTPDTPLEAGTVYYWQIAEQPGDAGPVYSFTTYAPPTGITREVWEGIGGTAVSDLTNNANYPCCPTWSDKLTSMASYDFADNYGAHMQGLLWPETSGDYTFWIAADDGTELWLSSDADPANLTKIAEHVGWNNAHNWYDSPEQQSAPITLVGGQKYWIRGIWKEGGGGDNCQVAWQGPDQPDAPVQGSDSAVVTNYWFPLDSLEISGLDPADGTPLTLLEAEDGISWSPKRGATYDVYFGEEGGSMALIASGLEASATPPVEVDKTYNWKVDAVYDTVVVEGTVQSFSVQEWVSVDIGRANPEPAGSSSVEDGVYTLKAGGNELWGQNDEFHYLYTTMEMTRDTGTIQARVLGIEHLGADWSRGGVQIRESRAPNSRKVMAHKTAADNTRMQWREQTGWNTWNTGDNWGLGFPLWVRLVRDHDTYNGYRSSDGENWTHLGSVWCPMPADKYVCIGLALCHHNGAPQDILANATFDNLSITTPDILASWNPSPSDGAENVPLYTTLSWGAGDDADEHRLYFSDNRDDVYYGLVDPVVLPGGTTEYEVGPLDLTKPYYWAVDEVIQEGRPWPVTLGDVWSFKVENYRLVEDFEPYDDPPVPIEDLPEQVVIVEGYTIDGYTIEAVEPNPDCLLALYDFEVDANDSSGNGYDGILIGDANVEGGVLMLDGDGDYVDCGNPDALNFGTGDWSICAWVKNTMTGTGDINKGSIIANGGDGGGGHRYGLIVSEQSEGKTTLVTDDNADKRQALSTTSVNDDVWRSIVGVREGNAIKIYVDGMLEATAGTPDPYDLSGADQNNVLIGAITKFGDGSIYKTYAGLIDKVRIYNCAMTEENLRWLAELGNLVVPEVIVPPVYGPMIAEYLVELPDPTADTSGNNFHGTPMGDVTIVEDAVRGYVATFDGNGDAVNIGNDPMFNPGYDDFSVSTWINMSSYGGNWGNVIIGKRGEGGLGWQIRRLSDTQRLSFTTRNCGDQDGWGNGGQNISLNEWHHVAAVRQGTQKWLYIDGQQEAVSGICDYIAECDHDVYIGARANGGNTGPESFFNGMVDDVRYYKNKALTYGEVLNLLEYESTNPIHDTWAESGAALTLDYFERHWGDKSMKVDIGSTGKVNRSTPFGDWDSGDAKALVLYFKGDPDNTLEQMYVSMTDPDEAVVLLDDGFEGTPWDANWEYEADAWKITSADPHVHSGSYSAHKDGGNGNPLTSIGLDTTDAVSINVGFWYQKNDGDYFRLYYYDGSNYNLVADLDSLYLEEAVLAAAPEWVHYTDTMAVTTDPEYFVSDFKIRFEAAIDASVWVDDVLIFKDPDLKVYYDYPEDLQIAEWQQWNINLQDFSDVGADLSNVDLLLIGFSGNPGGAGTVNFDDLRLYPSRCVAEYGPMADFTGDCLVDARDARVIALDWLERDYTVYAVEPDVAGLVARYEFDGNVNDTSGNDRHGTIVGDANNIITEDDPDRGMVLSLPGGDNQYVSLPEVGISGNDPTTITCWAKADHTSIPDWTLVFGFSTEGGGCGSHFNIGSIGGPGGVGAHLWCWESTIFTDDEALEWRHYAMTFDGTTTKSYGDGFQIAQVNQDLAIRGDRVNIGKRNTQASSFPGKVDDARIYNYQLSTEEIMSIAGVDEVYYPLESIANLYDEEPTNSKFINFKDYATLMEEWLYEQQWP